MKLFIHYEDNSNEEFHKTSKITLPKKWVDGPVRAVIELFVKAYNSKFPLNQLSTDDVHLETDKEAALANESIVSEYITPSDDVYVKHGPASTVGAVTAERIDGAPPPPPAAAVKELKAKTGGGIAEAGPLVTCKRFGCQKKYDPADNHEAACSYHRLPPVFHETAKFWACCPDKKCYSWDSFMQVQGCCTGAHTNLKPEQPSVLGGCDVRNGNDGSEEATERLKTIDDFNRERKAGADGGAGDAIAKMYQLRQAMDKAGIPGHLFDRAKENVAVKLAGDHVAVASEVASRISACLTAIADEK